MSSKYLHSRQCINIVGIHIEPLPLTFARDTSPLLIGVVARAFVFCFVYLSIFGSLPMANGTGGSGTKCCVGKKKLGHGGVAEDKTLGNAWGNWCSSRRRFGCVGVLNESDDVHVQSGRGRDHAFLFFPKPNN